MAPATLLHAVAIGAAVIKRHIAASQTPCMSGWWKKVPKYLACLWVERRGWQLTLGK
jgi:hypothetical protein